VLPDKKEVLHLGVAGSFRSLPQDGSGLSLSSRSEAFLFDRPLVRQGEPAAVLRQRPEAAGDAEMQHLLLVLRQPRRVVFTERSLADAFAPARNFGSAIGTHVGTLTMVTGVCGSDRKLPATPRCSTSFLSSDSHGA
jgi:hypothetical protein